MIRKELRQSTRVIFDAIVKAYQWLIGSYATANILIGVIAVVAALLLLALGNFVMWGTAPVPPTAL